MKTSSAATTAPVPAPCTGSVQDIPLEQDTIDLAISRGSVPFWEDLPTAFAEIHRVLAPGGQAYIGGGLGDPKTRALVEKRP